MTDKKNIAIFASGSGTNAEQIMKHFKDHAAARVKLVISNNSDAFVLERAKKFRVETRVFNRKKLNETTEVDDTLDQNQIDFIVLAGFMLLFPVRLVKKYMNRIVNIHPALLPKYGGKGMYGAFVHEAVVKNKDKESGISIHWVNEVYDEGQIIFQAKCEVNPSDTPESVAAKVHQLEYEYYPKVIEELVNKL